MKVIVILVDEEYAVHVASTEEVEGSLIGKAQGEQDCILVSFSSVRIFIFVPDNHTNGDHQIIFLRFGKHYLDEYASCWWLYF